MIGHACPLTIITGSLQTTRQSTGGKASADVTHATAETDCISCDDAMMTALVAQYHPVIVAATLVEFEGAQVHPGRTAHLLVHAELRGNTLMPHGIVRIVNASLNSLIADIDGISA